MRRTLPKHPAVRARLEVLADAALYVVIVLIVLDQVAKLAI
jgi:hypothetical protein